MHNIDNRRTPARRTAGLLASLRAVLGLDRFGFRNKAVLVTGGSRGLGLVLARRLVRAGARVAILARDQAELDRAREDLRASGATVLALRCDVRDRAQIQAAVRTVIHELGTIDVLINNAGVLQVGPLDTMTPEDYEDALRTNFWGPLHATLAVLPEMRQRGGGRIVNISSLGGKIAVPHLLPYTASKFALVGLSEGLRAELLSEGITVTTVCPGLMRTGSPYNAFFKGQHRKEFTWFVIADSLPLLSIGAESAARRILRAVRRGRAEISPGFLATVGARLHGLLPGLTTDLFGLVNRLLPVADGIGTRRARGRDSQTRLSSSLLTILTQRAARRNNELPPTAQPAGRHPSGAGPSRNR